MPTCGLQRVGQLVARKLTPIKRVNARKVGVPGTSPRIFLESLASDHNVGYNL